jgi:hypothetical protein
MYSERASTAPSIIRYGASNPTLMNARNSPDVRVLEIKWSSDLVLVVHRFELLLPCICKSLIEDDPSSLHKRLVAIVPRHSTRHGMKDMPGKLKTFLRDYATIYYFSQSLNMLNPLCALCESKVCMKIGPFPR